MPKIKNYQTRLAEDATGNEYVVVTDLVEGKTYKMKNYVEPPVNYDQDLNTTDDVTFATVTADAFTGDGSALTGIIHYDQDLSTTDDVTFNSISGDGSGLTGLVTFDQDLNTTDDVQFANTTITGGIAAGNDVENNWGQLPKTGFIIGINDTSVTGNTGMNEMCVFANIDAGYNNYNEFGIRGWVDDKMDFYLFNQTSGEDSNFIVDLGGTGGITQIRLAHAGDKMILNPTVAVTQTAYEFDTLNTLTTGKIASFQNASTEIMNVHAGGVDLAAGLEYTIDGVPLSGGNLKTIDPNGDGDYLTIEAAVADGQYKLFLVDGTHVVSGQMNVDAGTEILLRGESKEGTVIDFSGAGSQMFQANDDVAGDYNKWSATGTYTKSGNDLTFTGHENNDLTTVYAVGDKVVLGTHAGVGVAVIMKLTTNVMEVDTFTMSGLQDQHFGEADWIWTIGSCGLTVENLTLDTGIGNKTFVRQSLDDLVLWDYVLDGVRVLGRAYTAYDYDTCWRSVYNNTGGWEYIYFACRSIISNCDMKQVYIDNAGGKLYGGDAKFIGCTIQQDEGGNYLSPNTIFDSCLFLYDLTTQASHGQATADVAKFVDCIDINGTYVQPVASVTYGSAADTVISPDVAATGSSIAYTFDTKNTLGSNDKVFAFSNNTTEVLSCDHIWITGTERRFSSSSYTGQTSMMDAYSINAAGNLEADAYIIGRSDNASGMFSYLHDSAGVADYDQQITFQCAKSGGMIFKMQEDTRADQITGALTQFLPQVADGATAVAYTFKTGDDLSTAGAKIASFSNQNTEIMNITTGGAYITGGLSVGNDVEGNWGNLPDTGAIFALQDTGVTGNTGMNYMLVAANIDSGYSNYNELGVRGWINDRAQLDFYNVTTGEDSNFVVKLGGTGGTTSVTLNHGTNKMVLNPTASVTSTAYEFDTVNTLTTGKIASFQNNNTEVMAVEATGVNVTGNLSVNGVPVGWNLIDTQDVNDLTTGGVTVNTTNYPGFWFPDLDVLPYTRFKIRFKFMSANGDSYHKQRMFMAYDIDQSSVDYVTDSANEMYLRGSYNNEGVLTTTDTAAGVQSPFGVSTQPLWYIDAEFEFGFMQDTIAGYKQVNGKLSITEQSWNITEMCGISGPFTCYDNPTGYIAGNKPKNIWFVPGLAEDTGDTYDFSADVYECECTLFGMV